MKGGRGLDFLEELERVGEGSQLQTVPLKEAGSRVVPPCTSSPRCALLCKTGPSSWCALWDVFPGLNTNKVHLPLTPIRMATVKKQKITRSERTWRNRNVCTVGGNINWAALMQTSMKFSQKSRNGITSPSGYVPRELRRVWEIRAHPCPQQHCSRSQNAGESKCHRENPSAIGR